MIDKLNRRPLRSLLAWILRGSLILFILFLLFWGYQSFGPKIVKINEDPEPLTPTPASGKYIPPLLARVIAKEVSVRAEANPEGSELKRLVQGNLVQLIEFRAEWVYIEAVEEDWSSGWALKRFFEPEDFTPEPTDIAVENQTPAGVLLDTPTQVTTSTIEPTILLTQTQIITNPILSTATVSSSSTPNVSITPLLNVTPLIDPISTPTFTLIPPPEITPPERPIADAIVEASTLKLYSNPDVNSESIRNLDQNAELTVVGKTLDCTWLYVITSDGIQGWVLSDEVILNLDCTQIPISTPVLIPAPLPMTQEPSSLGRSGISASPKPDLVVESLTIRDINNATISFEYSIANQGLETVSASGLERAELVSVQVFISDSDGNNLGLGTMLGIPRLTNLAPGETYANWQPVTFASETLFNPNTTLHLTMFVDSENIVDESDEMNNMFTTAPLQITPTPTSIPTDTSTPTSTPTITPTPTPIPTSTSTQTSTSLPVNTPTITPIPTSTSTQTSTSTPLNTPTLFVAPSDTETPIPTVETPKPPTPTPLIDSYPSAACTDDEFLDLTANICRKLDRPDLGFDFGRFYGWLNENNVVNTDCNEQSFEAALAKAAGGGTVRLPACTMEIGRINVPSQVVIEGAGVGKTILKGRGCENAVPRRVLLIQDQSDVVVRDLSLDSVNRNCVMLESDHSTNILFERLEIYNSTEVGIRFNNGTRKITIRYTDIYNNGQYHAIGSKDCASGATLADCPEEIWTSSYSIHSNRLHEHGDHGLNVHGINGEVAGNLSYNNHHSGKFFDAQCIWVHHNEFRNNEAWNIFIAPTLNIEARASHDVYFYKNQYLDTPAGDFSWGITYTGDNVTLPLANYTNVYVMDNQYDGRLKTNEVTLNVCPNTTEDGISVSPKQYGDAATCSLNSYPSMGGAVYPQPLGNCPLP